MSDFEKEKNNVGSASYRVKTLISVIFVTVISVSIGIAVTYATGTGGLRIMGQGILDNAGTPVLSIDTNARQLISSTGSTTLSWANGNVGIGTTSPGAPLEVNYAINESKIIQKLSVIGIPIFNFGYSKGADTAHSPSYIDTDSSTRSLVLQTNGGNVGIGTTTPGYPLTVAGDVNFTGTLRQNGIAFAGSKWTATTSSAIYYNSGNVGIGTAAPGAKLDVAGTSKFGGNMYINPGYGITSWDVNGFFMTGGSNTGIGASLSLHGYAHADNGAFILQGSPTPYYDELPAVSKIIGADAVSTAVNYQNGGPIYIYGGNRATGGGSYGNVILQHNGTNNLGNVGIGTTTPVAKLDIYGTAGSADIFALSSSTNSRLFTVGANGNVGIGTASPGAKLSVRGTVGSYIDDGEWLAAGGFYRANNTDASASPNFNLYRSRGTLTSPTIVQNGDSLGYFRGNGFTTGTVYRPGARIDFAVDGSTISDSSMPGRITFSTTPSSSVTEQERMRIDNVGNVGIGTTAPQAKLEVSGIFRASGLANSSFTFPTSGVGFEMRYGTDYNALLGDATTGSGASIFQSYNRTGGTWEDIMIRGKNVVFQANNTIAMTLQATTGNVGIGTTTPGNVLTVATGSIRVSEKILSAGSSMTINWREGNQQLVRISTTGITMTFSNYEAGQNLKLVVCNPDAGTPGTITWPGTIAWSGGSAPTQTTTNSKCDIWSFIATMGTSTLNIFGAQSPEF